MEEEDDIMVQRSNLFANVENVFEFAEKDIIEKIAITALKELAEALDPAGAEVQFAYTILGAKLGVAGDGVLNAQEKALIDKVFGIIWKKPIEEIYEMVEGPINESDYDAVKLLAGFGNHVAKPFLYYTLSFAYIDGKIEDDVASRLDEIYGLNLLADFMQSGQENVPAPKVRLTGLEAEIVCWLREEDEMYTMQDIKENFSEYPPSEVQRAVNKLVRKDILYGGANFIGNMYGLCNADEAWEYEIDEDSIRAEKERIRKLEEERKEEERIQKEKEAAEKAEAERIAKEKAKELEKNASKMRARYLAASGMIASSYNHVVALKPDGTVIAAGKNDDGQCNVSGWRNVIAVACDYSGTVGLTSDGTVLYTGSNYHRETQCRSWRGIKQIAFSDGCVFGLKTDGTVIATTEGSGGGAFSTRTDVTTWRDITAIRAGAGNILGIKTNGNIVAISRNYYGRCEEDYYLDGATNAQDAAFGFLACGVVLHKDGKCTSAGPECADVVSPTEINKHHGIVKVDIYGGRPVAILADGSLVLESGKGDNQKDLDRFIREHNIKKVAAVSCSGEFAVLTADGRVFVKCKSNYYSSFNDEECFGKNFRLFDDFNKLMDDREAEAERIKKELEETERIKKEEELRRAERRKNGICQNCGGTFVKVLFGMKCTSCGAKKDYK